MQWSQDAEAHFLQDWKRRIDNGSHEAEVGDELESAEDYERAYQQQEDHVEHMTMVRKDCGIMEREGARAANRVEWKKSDHPLAKPMILRAGEMCQTVPHTVPLRVANVVLANDAADDECIVNNNNIFYSNFCVDLTEKLRRASSSCSIPVACLASSSFSDLLTLMHNRTGHGNLRMLIESAKSKLGTGL